MRIAFLVLKTKMSDEEGAAALPPSQRPANVFYRVKVFLEHHRGRLEQFNRLPFEATVRLEGTRMKIEHNDGGRRNEDYWYFSFREFREVIIISSEVKIYTVGGRITLGFRVLMPSRHHDTERFAHMILLLVPDSVLFQGQEA